MRGPGDEGDEGSGAQADTEGLQTDHEGECDTFTGADAVVVSLRRQPGEAENRYQLHYAEQP